MQSEKDRCEISKEIIISLLTRTLYNRILWVAVIYVSFLKLKIMVKKHKNLSKFDYEYIFEKWQEKILINKNWLHFPRSKVQTIVY